MKFSWQVKPLGEIAHVSTGNSAPQDKALFANGTHPFFRTADAGRVRFGEICESTDYLNERGINGLRCYPKGTILFPKSGASTFLNHRVMLGVEGFVSSHLATIVADESQVIPKFLLFFLSTIAAQDLVQDHAYPSLNLPTISGINIQLPPIAEQRRIVAILDEAFAGIATAKANAEKNLQNARALFESHLYSVFTRRPDELALSELASDVTDGDHSPPPKAPTGVPFITISNIIKRTREIDFSNTFTVPADYFQNLKPNKKPRVGDILYTVTGATLGIPVLVREPRDFCFQRHIGLIRPKPETDSAWLTYALLSPQVFRQATVGSTGAAQKTVSLSVLRNLKIPKISLPEQKRTAATLDALSAETQGLEAVYRQKLTALDELKKSLLHQAFSGEL